MVRLSSAVIVAIAASAALAAACEGSDHGAGGGAGASSTIARVSSGLSAVAWQRVPSERVLWNHPALIYDASAGCLRAFGSYTESWTKHWDDGWTAPEKVVGPSVTQASIAFDRARHRLVLLDSQGGTWERESAGKNWELRAAAGSSAVPAMSPMAYDEARVRTVLYGGRAPAGGDIWEWDGTTWMQRNPPAGPIPRDRAQMAYVPGTGVVIFGGSREVCDADFGECLAYEEHDLWSFDGTQWQELPTSPHSYGGRFVYDRARQRFQLIGDSAVNGELRMAMWELQNGTWQMAEGPSLPRRIGFGAVYDETMTATVVHGGETDDTLAWTPAAGWKEIEAASAPPPVAFGPALACALTYVSFLKRLVLFYDGALWEWIGIGWRKRSSDGPKLESVALTEDGVRKRVVLIGSAPGAVADFQTWEYDGSGWLERDDAQQPSPRDGACIAYDSVRQRTVLFGGISLNLLADTWEWDGTNWSQISTSSAPAPRMSHGIAWDPARERILVYGGMRNGVFDPSDGVWAYDGATWQPLATSSIPSSEIVHPDALAYDTLQKRVVLLQGGSTPPAERTWFLSGSDLSALSEAVQPDEEGGMAFDPRHGQLVFHGWNTWVLSGPGCVSDSDCAAGMCFNGFCCTQDCTDEQPRGEPVVPNQVLNDPRRPAGGCTASRSERTPPSLAAVLLALLMLASVRRIRLDQTS